MKLRGCIMLFYPHYVINKFASGASAPPIINAKRELL